MSEHVHTFTQDSFCDYFGCEEQAEVAYMEAAQRITDLESRLAAAEEREKRLREVLDEIRRDILMCQCHEDYTTRGLHAPDCYAHYLPDVDALLAEGGE